MPSFDVFWCLLLKFILFRKNADFISLSKSAEAPSNLTENAAPSKQPASSRPAERNESLGSKISTRGSGTDSRRLEAVDENRDRKRAASPHSAEASPVTDSKKSKLGITFFVVGASFTLP